MIPSGWFQLLSICYLDPNQAEVDLAPPPFIRPVGFAVVLCCAGVDFVDAGVAAPEGGLLGRLDGGATWRW